MRWPSGVMRWLASSAPSRCSSSRACASGPLGGASSHGSESDPHAASSSASCELDLCDFGSAFVFQALALRPQAIRAARAEASRAAGALVGGGLRRRDDVESREAGIRIEARLACDADVDDAAHAGQREARFGDVGRKHDASRARRGGREHGVLFGEREFAVQRDDVDAARSDCAECFAGAFDLALARQKREHIAVVFVEREFGRASKVRRPAAIGPRFARARADARCARENCDLR
jgi:hypothetical protein